MNRFSPALLVIPIFATTVLPSRGEWADEVGLTKLMAELGPSTPTGVGVDVTQVEASLDGGLYSPVSGDGTVAGSGWFAGKTFNIKSGYSPESFHAREVGWDFYGLNVGIGRYGMGSGVSTIDVYQVNDWVGSGAMNWGGVVKPATEIRKVQNHSWIGDPAPGEEADFNELLRRMDYAIDTNTISGTPAPFLCCVGANNGSSTIVPVLLGTAFNVVSVGMTSGNHSHGITLPDYDVPGRHKPEIVAPSSYTSFATGIISGAGASLRQVATTANGRRSQTQRAVLYAGATKEEFPAWARTLTQPIDSTFGFGEVNIYNSWKILSTTEQSKNTGANLTLQGWDATSLGTGATGDYLLNIPVALHGASLSAVVVWNRTVSYSAGNFTHNTLPNLSLELYRLPGTPGTSVDASNSTVDNFEHVWQPALLSGSYRLRVTGDPSLGGSTNYTIAWRVTEPVSGPTITPAGSFVEGQNSTLNFSHLVPGQLYELQSSDDLLTWPTIHTFTASTVTDSHTFVVPAGSRHFYKLKWTIP